MSLPSSFKYWHSSPQKRFRLATILSWPPAPHPSTVPLQLIHVPTHLTSHGQCEVSAWENWSENVSEREGRGSLRTGHKEHEGSSAVWKYSSLTTQCAEVGKAGLKKRTCPGERSSPAIATRSFTGKRFTLFPRTLKCLEKTQYDVVRWRRSMASGMLLGMGKRAFCFSFKSEKEGEEEDCERESPETR